MGSSVMKEQIRRDRVIQEYLNKDALEQNLKMKLLLLGTYNSGKSTIFKQMRILHMKGFSESDLINYKYLIYQNVVLAVDQLLYACGILSIPIRERTQKLIEVYKSHVKKEPVGYQEINDRLASVIKKLWDSEEIQKAFRSRGGEVTILDSAKYLLNRISKIGSESYTPTEQDILRSRDPTVTISEIEFPYKTVNLRMVDVGGQKTEMKKWIHLFDNVKCLLFIAAVSDYNLFVTQKENGETINTNLLQYGLKTFKSVISQECFQKTAVVLFLNKFDIFMEKLQQYPLSICFTDYQDENYIDKARTHVQKKFLHAAPKSKTIFWHFTIATDTNNIDFVFNDCMKSVMDENVASTGLA